MFPFKSAFFMLASLSLLAMTQTNPPLETTSPAEDDASCSTATIHYQRRKGDYDGWGLHVWGPTTETSVTWENPLAPTGEDDFGLYWEVPLQEGAEVLNYIIHKGDQKDPGPDQTLTFAEKGCEIWQVQGKRDQFSSPEEAEAALEIKITEAPEIGENQVLLHYRRTDEEYDGWGLHVWGPTAEEGVTWTNPLLPTGQDAYGLYWVVDMQEGADHLNYIVHRGDEKDPGPDQTIAFEESGREVWLIQGSGETFSSPEEAREALLVAGIGDIQNKARAHWVAENTIAWDVPFGDRAIFTLHHSPDGSVEVTREGLVGGEQIPLQYLDDQLPAEIAEAFPHLRHYTTLTIPEEYLSDVPTLLRGQTALTVETQEGEILGATALQVPGVLDDLYATDRELGVVFEDGKPHLRVWAPTAKSVTLHLFDDPNPETSSTTYPMERDPETGIWAYAGQKDWPGKYYLYEVEVYYRQEGEVVRNLVTDPYSLSLSQNSARSQIIDLQNPDLFPDDWEKLEKPGLDQFTEIAIYELHVRDFSIYDKSVPEEHRGTYLAFTHPDSNGMQHLRSLAEAGLTHLHLLPTFDIATINEDKSTWEVPDPEQLAQYPPDSPEPQAVLQEIDDRDGYNWGYDPYHYNVPEGSYSTDPDGTPRILEYRSMVKALNETGLRVVADVVYNHTNASGLSEKSVLDQVVPGYYHRLDADGRVTNSTCCANTATEHVMMRKLMVDSVLLWAKAYKIDGFRFDLMGHHMKADMLAVRSALDSLTLAEDGVDGKSIFIYGEGWDFGEVAHNARGVNATQANLAGTGIGTFNDRIRDAARGGGPFGDKLEQGYLTGLFTAPNEANPLPLESQRAALLDAKDQIRVSLAGNLADYEFTNAEGFQVTGSEVGYNGQPAGYTQIPTENILYVSAHDNETLFDALQYKLPLSTPMEDRVRVQNLGLSLVAFSQGVPFYHAGSDLLRSKSMDRDSYDSGDWFNALDWTYQDNNWGHGLPPADKNESSWPLIQERLANPGLAPDSDDIQFTRAHFQEILAIRKSSPLFQLQTADQIQDRLHFHNTGPEQIPGLIALSLQDTPEERLDPRYDLIIVLFNADPETVEFAPPGWEPGDLKLHPVLQNGPDPVVKEAEYDPETHTFSVPGRTAAVFVRENPTEAPLSEVPASASFPTWIWVLGLAVLVIGLGIYLWSRLR